MLSSFCQFDPLKEVWLGDVYPNEFFDHLDGIKNKDTLKIINDITREDLDKIEQQFKSLGIKVRRPEFTNNVDDYLDQHGNLLKPPITPRDENIMIGTTFYNLRTMWNKNPWQRYVDEYRQTNEVVQAGEFDPFGYLICPSILRLGKDLFVDSDSHSHCWGLFEKQFIEHYKSIFRIHVGQTDGHADSVFCILNDKKIITSHWKPELDNEFPGWDVLKLPWRAVNRPDIYFSGNFEKSWYIDADGHQYPAFNPSIDKFAMDWIGNAQETVYEVNSLSISPTMVMTTGEPTPQVKKWLEEAGITYIPVEFRAKGFWDAGINCITTDIDRENSNIDLWPDLKMEVIHH